MSTVSAVIIVKNEEAHLAQCLSTLQWVDELVVLDSGSTDATCRIAASFNARVEQAEDWQGFGIQRQRAQAFVVPIEATQFFRGGGAGGPRASQAPQSSL